MNGIRRSRGLATADLAVASGWLGAEDVYTDAGPWRD